MKSKIVKPSCDNSVISVILNGSPSNVIISIKGKRSISNFFLGKWVIVDVIPYRGKPNQICVLSSSISENIKITMGDETKISVYKGWL